MVPLLTAFSAMTIQYSGTSNGQSINYTASYNVVYSSSSTIKVDVNYAAGSTSEALTAYILKTNGTIFAVDEAGYNITGTEGQDIVIGTFAGFIIEIDTSQSLPVYTSVSGIQDTGTSSVTIGSSTFSVTNYALSGPSVTVNTCSGSSDLTAFSLSVGTPSGSNYKLITTLNEAGSFTSDGTTSNVNFTMKVTSLTVG